jgi:hypothetical protein
MAQHPHKDAVLIIDNDLGFLFALGDALAQAQISLIPAVTAAKARSTLRQLDSVPSVLVVNCRIRDVCGFAADTARTHGTVVLGIQSRDHQCRSCRSLLAYCFEDPADRSPECISKWVDVIAEQQRGDSAIQ